MRESLRLGSIAGVAVGLNVSVVVIAAIIVVGLAAGRFPVLYPDLPAAAYVGAAVAAAVLFFASLLAHELAHAVVARRNGIEVDRITLWLFGGVAQLKGEPRTAGADLRIAAVGPATSMLLGIGFGVIGWLMTVLGVTGLPVAVPAYLAGVNVLLAVFNLVPAAPLDGGRVLRAALWRWRGDRVWAAVTAAQSGRVFGYFLVALGVFQFVTGRGFGGVWLALIGLFLVNAASAEEQQVLLGERLRGIRVRDVMGLDPVTARPDTTLEDFIGDVALKRRFSTYPLTDEAGRFVGLATLNRIRDVDAHDRPRTRLADLACAPDDVPKATTDEPLSELVPRMAGCSDGRAVVLDHHGRVVGVISPSDISRAIQRRDLVVNGTDDRPRGADLASWWETRTRA